METSPAAISARSGAFDLGRLRRPLALGLFVEAPLIALVFVVWWSVWGDARAMGDFVIFRDAGQAVLHGHSPYVAPDPGVLAENDKFVYPAPVALAFVPFALLPLGAAKLAFILLSLVSVAIALRLLGVRDPRCYGVVLLASPAIFSFEVGSLGPFLLLGAALAWRLRHRLIPLAAAVAATALAKLLLWPLFVWLVATRRLRAAAAAAALTCVLALGGWAAIGFHGLREYPALVRVLSEVQVWKSYSLSGLAAALGGTHVATAVLTAALALAGVAIILLVARSDDGDRLAFVAAIGVSLLASPILWQHYLILLFVPIALARPRISPLWFAPLAFWLTPQFESLGSIWKICTLLVLTAAVLVRAARATPATELALDRVAVSVGPAA